MERVSVGDLREGSVVILDEEPCRITKLDRSKPGKHGSAKVRAMAVGIFDGSKRSFTNPVDAMMESPRVNKRRGQVLSVSDSVQIMDTESYDVFETGQPEDEELMSKIESGVEVEYWEVAGRTKIVRVV